MNGIIQKFEFRGTFTDFVEKCQALNATGGGWVFKDGHGFFVEPDLTESFGLDVVNLGEVIYKKPPNTA